VYVYVCYCYCYSKFAFIKAAGVNGESLPSASPGTPTPSARLQLGDEESDVCSESSLSSPFVLDVCGVVLILEERIPNPYALVIATIIPAARAAIAPTRVLMI
jgi:hypothetical protein